MHSRLVGLIGLAVLVLACRVGTTESRLAQTPPSAGKPGTEAVIVGELEVLVEDSDRGSRVLYFLMWNSQRISLRFQGTAPDLTSGTRVRVQGRWGDDGSLAVTSIEPIKSG